MNPAVEKLLQDIAQAKLRAEERRRQKEELDTQTYGIIHQDDGTIELRLPPPPTKPDPDECCHSGCTPCILDTYQEQLEEHKQLCADFQQQYQRAKAGKPTSIQTKNDRMSCGILNPLEFRKVRILHIDQPCMHSRLLVLEATALNFILAHGEHIHIRALLPNGNRITRPFTPVMLEAEDGIVRPHLFIRLYDNELSASLERLQAGDHVMLRGPIRTHVDLTHAFSSNLCVLVAGGSGIAPIFQALQFAHINSSYKNKQMVVLHCARNEQALWLSSLIKHLQADMPHLAYHTFVSHTQRLSESLLHQVLADYNRENAQAIVCGPGTFNEDVSCWLNNIGIKHAQLL
ncbi:NADH-cytochrome b5 reductase-like [Coemansia sp. RSA 1290]|nr:NADH-cytochrome b5 reductase-like [Coemansia sp. RSA 1821]KAJ2632312.1 NADH-cytochrome b5 reductase-like [Coemansia sp. RSA 1290]KAJ2650096.1 NADH-cytochrome b5 reductase-like [Coemansia sp. RSA 1250]